MLKRGVTHMNLVILNPETGSKINNPGASDIPAPGFRLDSLLLVLEGGAGRQRGPLRLIFR